MNPIVNQLVRRTGVRISTGAVVVAHYDPEKNEIVLPIFWDSKAFLFVKNAAGRKCNSRYATLYHEVGHALDERLGLSETAAFRKVFGDASKRYKGTDDARLFQSPSEGFVSAYAESHPVEDFADTFAAYIMGYEYDDPVIEEKMGYVEKVIKKALKLS